ncbi:hypothetical protein RSAG8_13460, partial [Rhizoctonia solani AG-8 WAC10335]
MPSSVLSLPFMDLNSAAESVTLSAGITFSGAVDQCHVKDACDRVARAWPILGSRVQRNSQNGKIEAVIPAPDDARLKVTFQPTWKVCIQKPSRSPPRFWHEIKAF